MNIKNSPHSHKGDRDFAKASWLPINMEENNLMDVKIHEVIFIG